MGVRVETVAIKGEDERGKTTELDLLDRPGPYILAYRKKGSKSGNHYHQGNSELKSPEVLYLLQGKLELRHALVHEGRIEAVEKREVVAPSKVEVDSLTWHEVVFLEDSIFLELNSFAEGDKDTFRL